MRRELLPQNAEKSGWFLSFSVCFLEMLLLTLGLALFLSSGFDLALDPWLLYGGVAALCLVFTVFYYHTWLDGARGIGAVALILATALAALFLQQSFLSGARQVGAAVLVHLKNAYHGDFMTPAVDPVPTDVSVFLLLVFVPVTAYLGAFAVRNTDTLLVNLLIFPVAMVLLLLSAAPSMVSMVLLCMGILAVAASDRVGYRRNSWGQKDTPRGQQNQLRRHRVSAFSAVVLWIGGLLLMVPSFFVLMPSLSVPISQAAPFAQTVEGKVAEGILSLIPHFYGGGLSSPVSTFGGGVADGKLTDSNGYLISDVEDLRLTCTQKPEETVYLKGFVGGDYQKNQWLAADAAAFANAARDWDVEGDPGIYIQNLPFLRMRMEESQAGEEASFGELTVQRLNANGAYTYTPYGSYLNEYYEVGGDGFVSGQTVQDDSFLFYFRQAQMENLEEEYFLQNETALDRQERTYAAFVQSQYTHVPEGFAELQAQCDSAELENGKLEDIIAFVQTFLKENYTYSLELPPLPENADAVRHFLYESKIGCSPQFASAATVMLRMLGVPARYVVGYAASKSLFTPQPDGTYQAVLQSDNAHAWAEIYISGVGWMPVETTPGQLGLVQDVEFFGQDLTPETTAPPATEPEELPTQTPPQPEEAFPVAEVVTAVLAVVILALLGLLAWKCLRDLGFGWNVPAALRARRIFAAYYRRLLRAGMPRQVESTSAEFPQWAEKLDTKFDRQSFDRMVTLVVESCFGRRKVRQTDVVWLRKYCLSAWPNIRKQRKTS